jgi:hypothetical protein
MKVVLCTMTRTIAGANASAAKRNRHRSVGSAAEIGVELRVSEHVHLKADLRWIEIEREAMAIRTGPGLVAADLLSFEYRLAGDFAARGNGAARGHSGHDPVPSVCQLE